VGAIISRSLPPPSLRKPTAGRRPYTRAIEFGVGYFPTHDAPRPDTVARLAEEHGQDSLFFAEHTHIPASRESPYPGGGELPHKYSHTYDPFVALTAAAAATSKLRVGTGICLVIERDPIITAKEVASLDHLSGGRFEFGVGAGWNREEMANHGTDARQRMRVMSERVEAMKAIWMADEASYQGEFVNFERIWSWPKPLQRPHPPVLIGGNGPTVLDRVLALGDAWFPNYARGDDLVRRAGELRRRATRPIDFMVIGVPGDAGVFEELREAGCRRVVHWLPSAGLAAIEAALERWESAIAEFTGGE
jgi:probable F420-dependent oxidoreductase